MFRSELQFLCDVLNRSRVRTVSASLSDPVSSIIDASLFPLFSSQHLNGTLLSEHLGKVEPNTLYRMTDSFGMSYLYLMLPGSALVSVLYIGPFVQNAVTPREVLEIGERNEVTPKNQKLLDEYYMSIPVISDTSPLLIMIDTFCERIWGSNYSSVDIESEKRLPPSPINESGDHVLDELPNNMTLMEKRYAYESEIMSAVTRGHSHKANQLFSAISQLSFSKRVADPLRNLKNYCIIMNTLFRKAAENGGVHPIYLDRVSSGFAVQIEQMGDPKEIENLMKDMFRSYCRLVRKHSMKEYSPIVQKTITFIESDLSSNLTLNTLSQLLNVSGGYLSTIFKKETGTTVTEYIRDKRMKHAAYLLSSTHLQIQTVALHCGIMDVQYFSKQFKKHTGMTPKEYRENSRKN